MPDPDPANPDPYGFYLKNCQKYDKATKKWISTTGNLTNERAYASSVVVPKTSDNTEVTKQRCFYMMLPLLLNVLSSNRSFTLWGGISKLTLAVVDSSIL